MRKAWNFEEQCDCGAAMRLREDRRRELETMADHTDIHLSAERPTGKPRLAKRQIRRNVNHRSERHARQSI